jgi:hypothetical protein
MISIGLAPSVTVFTEFVSTVPIHARLLSQPRHANPTRQEGDGVIYMTAHDSDIDRLRSEARGGSVNGALSIFQLNTHRLNKGSNGQSEPSLARLRITNGVQTTYILAGEFSFCSRLPSPSPFLPLELAQSEAHSRPIKSYIYLKLASAQSSTFQLSSIEPPYVVSSCSCVYRTLERKLTSAMNTFSIMSNPLSYKHALSPATDEHGGHLEENSNHRGACVPWFDQTVGTRTNYGLPGTLEGMLQLMRLVALQRGGPLKARCPNLKLYPTRLPTQIHPRSLAPLSESIA